MQGKRFASGLSILTIGAVLWPIVQNSRQQPKDNFPLSYYPMFTADRSQRAQVTHLLGLDARGRRYPIPYGYAGAGGLNQVRRQLRELVRIGRADELCRSVASKIGRESGGPFAGVVTVQVVTGEYRLADYFTGTRTPLSERVHASREVERALP
ncbi:MAG: hypothetical protein H0V51_20305 [Chloroflexi bacterium]|nr:hypothetical protein [Chloroflexota bacterium]